MTRPRLAQADGQIGFHWMNGETPISLPDLVAIDEEPERLVPTHLEALDDALIDATGRFGELLGGGRPPAPGLEWVQLAELADVLDRLIVEYADATTAAGLPVEIRGGQIIGTAALIAARARLAMGIAGPYPFAGALDDPRIGVVSGHGQLQRVDPARPWTGARWVVASEDGRRFPLTLSMLLFDSSGVNKEAALDEHREVLCALVAMTDQTAESSIGDGAVVSLVLAGAIEWLLVDFLMAHRDSAESAAIELRPGRVDDARMIVSASAAAARLRGIVLPAQFSAERGAGHGR